jgi:hypothetical protein
VADDQLIDEYLAALARRLPGDVVDELADGVLEACQLRVAAGLDPEEAARATIQEFGTPSSITRAFVAEATGRRTARALLVTGPAVGVCWGAALVTAQAWRWSLPPTAVAGGGLALVFVVAALLGAARSRDSLRLARLGTPAAAGLVALDVTMVVGVLLVAPTLSWPMAVAIPASLLRVASVLRTLPTRRTP